MIYVQIKTRPKQWDPQNSLRFWDAPRSPNPDQKTKSSDNYHKKINNCIVDSAILTDNWEKSKKVKIETTT